MISSRVARPAFVHLSAILLIGLLAASLLDLARLMKIHVDESPWITSGYITYRLVVDLAPPDRWETAYSRLGSWGNMNPPVGKLLIGLFTAHAITENDVVAYNWDWEQTREWNLTYGRMPPPHVLLGVRAGMVVTGTLCLLLAYLVAVQLVGVRWIALWAPVSLMFNTVFAAHSAMALTSVPQLLFLLLASWLFNQFLVRRKWPLLIGAAIAMGLACAVKFNSAPLVAVALLFAVRGWPDMRRRLLAASGIAAIPLMTFVAVNPYLYAAPLQRTRSLLQQWSATIAQQQADPLLGGAAVGSPGVGAALVMKRAVVSQDRAPPHGEEKSGAPTLLEVLALVIVAITLIRRGWRDAPPGRWRRLAPWVILLVGSGVMYGLWYGSLGGASFGLLIAGLVGLWRSTAARNRDYLPAAFVALVFIMFAVCTSLWLPFDWARYYLPATVWIPILQVVGLDTLGATGSTQPVAI